MELLGFFPQFRAMILSVLPNVVQGVFAAIADYYTWKMTEKMYGLGSNSSWAAVGSPSLNAVRLLILMPVPHDSAQPLAMVLLNQDLLK